MLGKLLKHEFLSCGRKIVPVYLILIAASFLGKFFIWLSSNNSFIDSIPSNFYVIITGLSSIFKFIYVVLILFVLVGTFLFLIYRFYHQLFSDEGYLTLTLPVKPYQHVLSKLISCIVWTIFSVAIVSGSLGLILRTKESIEKFNEFKKDSLHLIDYVSVQLGISSGFLIAEIIIFIFIIIALKFLMIYSSITIGSCFSSKNKILTSIIAYIIIGSVIQAISFIIIVFSPTKLTHIASNIGEAFQTIFFLHGGLNIILCAIFFFTSSYLLKNKTNLD